MVTCCKYCPEKRGSLHKALGLTTTNIPCQSPECPVHQARRPSSTKPFYGGPLSTHNVIPVIEPPRLPHHDRSLYEVYNDITEEEESEVTRMERIVDKRDEVQAVNEIESIWRELMIKGYRSDPVYQLAQDSGNTSRGGKMQHYRIRDGLLYATTRGGEDCHYIPKRHEINGETLRELMISEIHNKGHHSADSNLRHASEYIYWPEMRKDFRDFVRQCDKCQANKERTTLPDSDAQTLPFPSEIFSSYAIDFMGPFAKLKGQDSVLVVVDRAVGFSWLMPTSVTAIVVQTTELLRHHIFTPHGVSTSIVSDADPRFTSKFWKQTLKTMGIEHIMTSPGHYQTNGQAEREIREHKTALRNVVNLRQTNWLTSLPEVTAYSNAGHSDTINMSPYKGVYG